MLQGVERALAALLPLHASAPGEGFEGYDVPLLGAVSKLLGRLPSGHEAVMPTCLQVSSAPQQPNPAGFSQLP